jgi:hypothetical protein
MRSGHGPSVSSTGANGGLEPPSNPSTKRMICTTRSLSRSGWLQPCRIRLSVGEAKSVQDLADRIIDHYKRHARAVGR